MQWLVRQKNVLIAYDTLAYLSGFNNFDDFQSAHRQWVQAELSRDKHERRDFWTKSIATGSRSFVEDVKMKMGGFAVGRHVHKNSGNY